MLNEITFRHPIWLKPVLTINQNLFVPYEVVYCLVQ